MPVIPFYVVLLRNIIDKIERDGFWYTLKTDMFFLYMFIVTIIVFFVILCTAVLTFEERKEMAGIQHRVGPKKVGFLGLLQAISDAFKLLLKEYLQPNQVLRKIFNWIAAWGFISALAFWFIAPDIFEFFLSTGEVTVLFNFLINVFHAYSILLSGWSSKSKYSFLGSLRSAAQVIAYDIVLILVLLNIYVYVGDLSYTSILIFQNEVGSFIFYFPVQFVIFVISGFAETSRHPFDLPEAEPELVSGYNVEFSSFRFALFFLAEYSSVVFFAVFLDALFLGGWTINGIFWFFKIMCIIYVIIEMRATLPRYRYDQLMATGWTLLIPLELALLFSNIITQNIHWWV